MPPQPPVYAYEFIIQFRACMIAETTILNRKTNDRIASIILLILCKSIHIVNESNYNSIPTRFSDIPGNIFLATIELIND